MNNHSYIYKVTNNQMNRLCSWLHRFSLFLGKKITVIHRVLHLLKGSTNVLKWSITTKLMIGIMSNGVPTLIFEIDFVYSHIYKTMQLQVISTIYFPVCMGDLDYALIHLLFWLLFVNWTRPTFKLACQNLLSFSKLVINKYCKTRNV